jgi:hypothetical protein
MAYNRLVAFSIFLLLDVVFWWLWADAIPRRDKVASLMALLGILVLQQVDHSRLQFIRTKRSMKIFAIVVLTDVIVSILLPWILIVLDLWTDSDQSKPITSTGYIMASHLFVFQSQIAMEELLKLLHENAKHLFWYTVTANAYRVWALAESLSRTWAVWEHISIIQKMLPLLSILLWVGTNSFLAFVWYPLQHTSITKDERLARRQYTGAYYTTHARFQ